MSDNLMISATGLLTDEDRLRAALALAPSDKYRSAVESQENGEIFLLLNRFPDDATGLFVVPLPATSCMAMILAWLTLAKYPTKPDIDGSCRSGWRVEATNMTDELRIYPEWMIFHK